MSSLENWLIRAERKYGGIARNVARRKVSDHDPRTPEELARGGMQGGDRMLHHGYAAHYAQHLATLKNPWTVVELGILRGTGLAIWAELFPTASVIGLDVDISHFHGNRNTLLRHGLRSSQIEVHEFDELAPDAGAALDRVIGGRRIDVMIDDALHYDSAILRALEVFMPRMASPGLYFVEDNRVVHKAISARYPALTVHSHDRLTVIET